jgi:hypothetical protein
MLERDDFPTRRLPEQIVIIVKDWKGHELVVPRVELQRAAETGAIPGCTVILARTPDREDEARALLVEHGAYDFSMSTD